MGVPGGTVGWDRGLDSWWCHWNSHWYNPSGRTMALVLTQPLPHATHSSALKMEAVCFSETLVHVYQTVWEPQTVILIHLWEPQILHPVPVLLLHLLRLMPLYCNISAVSDDKLSEIWGVYVGDYKDYALMDVMLCCMAEIYMACYERMLGSWGITPLILNLVLGWGEGQASCLHCLILGEKAPFAPWIGC